MTSDDRRWGRCECNEDDTGTHWKGCHLRPMELTKAEFVDACEGGASAAVDSYVFLVHEGFSEEEAKEIAVDEAIETGTCFAGIGSCYGGGCKHG